MQPVSSFPDKKAARRHARAILHDFLAEPEKVDRVNSGLFSFLNEFSSNHPTGRLLASHPLSDEIDCRAVWADFPGRVYLPVAGPRSEMSFCLFQEAGRRVSELSSGRFQILEPVTGAALLEEPLTADDLVLVPGLAVAGDGARLGRGGGFYDRWGERFGPALLVGVLPAAVCGLDFPAEAHDLRLNRVVTELGLVDY